MAWLKIEGMEGDRFWIGMTDTFEEGEFKWRSGHPSSFDDSELWHDGEPGGGERENCAYVLGLEWRDRTCSGNGQKVICQKRSSAGTSNKTNDLKK